LEKAGENFDLRWEDWPMDRPRLPVGDYYQLLWKNGLLAGGAAFLDLTRPVSAVVCDSRAAVPGSLFICKGAAFRPEYLTAAVKAGAFAYVSERFYEVSAPCIRVKDIRRAMGVMADLAWGHPSGQLRIVGITGTKGKTTAAWFLKTILDVFRSREGKHPAGLLSTLVTDDGLERRAAVLTTPEPLDLQRHLWNAVNAGCEYLVMEVSSQALKYGRVTGVELDTAVFLNIGQDHISPQEHPDFEDYFASKLRIFRQADSAVVDLDADHAGEILRAARGCRRLLTCSRKNPAADLFASRITRTPAGLAFTVEGEEYAIPMAGSFNAANALAALAVCRILGIPSRDARAGLAQARVPGRMETYSGGGKTVIVDYAHNGMALEALLQSVRGDYPGVPVTVVFGCTGAKGLDRRAGMGTAAGRLADRVILTEDDPGSEKVVDICREIGRYVALAGGTYETVPDREEAVRRAVERSPSPGVIVLAGKGAERQQKRENGPEPCVPDGLLARKYLGLPLA